jgi:ubiquinone biosynthesis protein COQ4
MMQAAPSPTPGTLESDLAALPRGARARRALRSLGRILEDPTRTDEVLEFSATVNAGSGRARVERFFAEPGAAALYAERRAITARTVDLAALAALPEGTLGHAYARFLADRGLTPDVFEAPIGVSDERVGYVAQRFRQTHDLWHVVTGLDTDAASEIVLQAFTYGQTGAPSTGILATLGTLRAATLGQRLGRAVVAAFRAGRRARYLGAFAWEDHWATPLAEVRARLGVAELRVPDHN